jgi:hypothetical protein
MKNKLIVFDEPDLEFRYAQKAKDPRDGLGLFGPFDADLPSHPKLNHIVLGTTTGIDAFNNWAAYMNHPIIDAPNENFRLWPPFPGFQVAFNQRFPQMPIWSFEIGEKELLHASRLSDPHQRAFDVVDKYLEGIKIASKRDENIGIAICVVPEEVWKNCRPESQVIDAVGEKISRERIESRKAGQLEFFSEYDSDQYELSRDFRRQLKARAMEYDIPIQISVKRPLD